MLYYLDTVPVPPNIQAYLQSRTSPQLTYARPGEDKQGVRSKDKRCSSATFSRDFKFKKDSPSQKSGRETSHKTENNRGKSKSFCNFKSKIPLVVTSSVQYDCNGNLGYDTNNNDVSSRREFDVYPRCSSFDSDTSSEMSLNSSTNSTTNCLSVQHNYHQPRRCQSALSYHQAHPASRQLSAPAVSNGFGMRREKSNIPVPKSRSKSLDKRRSKSTERSRSPREQTRSHSPGIPILIDGNRGRRGKRDDFIESTNDVFVRSSSPIVNHSHSSKLYRSVDNSFRILPNCNNCRSPSDCANGYTSSHRRHRRTTTSSSCGSSGTSLSRSSDCDLEVKVHIIILFCFYNHLNHELR